MKNTVTQLLNIVEEYSEKLRQLSEEDISLKLHADKWSKKEELGHLVDSAHNNLRRFIVVQYETNPKIVYDQDTWVRITGYAYQPSTQLINLWILLNLQICYVLEGISAEAGERMCDTGKENEQLRSLNWLAEDYVKHLLHHLHHLLELEAVAY